MARFRGRFKKHELKAKYVCPVCGRVGYYRCWLEMGYSIYGRPREDYCPCGALTEYRGFTSRYKETVPHAWGGRRMLRCGGCGKDTEHACMREGDKLWRCLECGSQRLADDAAEAARLQERASAPRMTSEELYGRD